MMLLNIGGIIGQMKELINKKRILIVLLTLCLLFTGCTANDPNLEAWYQRAPLYVWDGAVWIDVNTVVGGAGDVVGPAGATDHAIARYDGVTGLLIQNSPGVTIDDFDNLVVDSDIDTVTGDINSGNDVNVTNDLDVTDNADVGGDLGVIGDATVGGDLGVTGTANIDEYVNVGGSPPVVLPDGGAYFDSMVRIRTEEGGGGIFVLEHDWAFPIHTGTGSFDLTGGAYENYFTATAPVFQQEDEDLNNFIAVISGTYLGYVAEIINYIDTTHVVLDTYSWDADLAGVPFAVVRHPSFAVGDAGKVGISAGASGNLHIHSVNQTSECLVDVTADVGADDLSAVCVEVDVNGYSASEAIRVRYATGDLQPGDHAALLKMSMDEVLAVNSDATTHIDFIELLTTDTENATKHAIHIGQGFDSALIVSSGTEEDPDHGYTVVPDVATNRVTGAPGAGTAFLEASASDVLIFNADNDYILIGSDATFEAIAAILVSGANVDVQEDYYYSTGAGTWAPLIVSDTVNGFRQSGTITFNAPAGWALTNATVPAGAAITNAFYVKIVRTRNNVGAPPVEDYFKTFTSSSTTDFEIRGDGTIRPVEMADAAAPNNSLYYSTTQAKLVYKDNAGNVHALW